MPEPDNHPWRRDIPRDIPRDRHLDRVQIMGSPEQGWSLDVSAELIAAFLRAQMARASFSAARSVAGETVVGFDYRFPPGFELQDSFGSLRLAPVAGLSFDALGYGMTHDLLELLARHSARNKDMVVIFSEARALFHPIGMPRNEGIHRLLNACHLPLVRLLFPDRHGEGG